MSGSAAAPFQAASPPIILASGSASRRAVLHAAGLHFTAISPGVDEAAVKLANRRGGGTPEQTATALAALKAASVPASDALVIGSDQILVCNGVWFDKPANLDAARQHLMHLRGRAHTLVTATVLMRNGQRVWSHLARPRLVMRSFTNTFLDAYLAQEGDAVLNAVGAYRVEGPGAQLFESMEGEHSAILGLPLLPLLAYLREAGVVLT